MPAPKTKDTNRIRDALKAMIRKGPPEVSAVFDASGSLFMCHFQLISSREKIGKRLFGLNIAELKTLVMLRACKHLHDVTHSELQQETMLTSGGQTKVLKSLEEKGYIDVAINPDDGRSKWISITEQGLQVVQEMFPQVAVEDHEFYRKNLTEKEFEELKRLLKKLTKDL